MHRVVITGFGAISPIGLTAEESWKAALKGQSGVGPLTLEHFPEFPVKFAAQIKGFDPHTVMDRKDVRRNDRFEWIAHAAAQEALKNSGLEITEDNRHRIGVIVSSAIGGIFSIEEQVNILYNDGPRRVHPFGIPKIMSNGASGTLSIRYGLGGPSFSVASACASGQDGIGTASQLIRAGLAEAILAGGAEASVTPLALSAFARIGAASQRESGTPSPFSANRDGLVMGEGAAVLVLESLDHAKARGANILGELIGYGSTADAFHITAPSENGEGSARAIRIAMEQAQINAEDLDYINAHGTGTPLNDESETRAIKRALGEQAYQIPISSTKSMTGHMMGATGALESVFCLQAIRDNMVPPTINYEEPDEICDLDYIPNEAREKSVRIASTHAFGFGGHNAVLIFKEFNGK